MHMNKDVESQERRDKAENVQGSQTGKSLAHLRLKEFLGYCFRSKNE